MGKRPGGTLLGVELPASSTRPLHRQLYVEIRNAILEGRLRQSLDQDDRVIYVGNFSKTIVPSLRIGYVVVPPALVETFTRVRATMSRQPPGGDQAILADFIGEGHLERHVRATQRLYRARQEAMVEAIRSSAGDLLAASPNGTGMYLVASLRDARAAGHSHAAHDRHPHRIA